MHHHVVEYPRRAKALSVRIGTALVNGNWFVRRLKPLARRIVLMHGHRLMDWIGECGRTSIISAPSPVMEATDDMQTYFYIHTLAVEAEAASQVVAPAANPRCRENRSSRPKAAITLFDFAIDYVTNIC